MISHIEFLSARAAALRQPHPAHAMISITDPRQSSPVIVPGWGGFLHLQFTDSEYDEQTCALLGPAFGEVFASAMTGAHARAILSFLAALDGRASVDTLLVHCHRGESRSAAVARYCAERYGVRLDGDTSRYNRLVYSLLHNPARFPLLQQLCATSAHA